MANPSDSNAAQRNPWNRNPPPAAAASSAAAVAVLAEEPWPPLTAPQIAAEESQPPPPPPPPPPAVVAPVPPPPPPPNRHPNSSGSRRGGRHSHHNQNHHRRNQGMFHPNHHQNRFPAPPFHPPPQHVRNPNPNPNLAFGPALPPMQPPHQQVWFPPPPADWTMIVPRPPLYTNGHGYMDGGFAPPPVYHPMIGAHPQFPPMGPTAAQVPPVQGGPVAGLPNQDAQLMEDIRRQIEYYFSEENLVKDAYLKQKMDEFGWVDLGLIASFRKVAALTKDLEMIRSAMTISHSVQLEGDKMRVRHDWQKWTLT